MPPRRHTHTHAIEDDNERLGLVAAAHAEHAGSEIDYTHRALYLYGVGEAPEDVLAITCPTTS